MLERRQKFEFRLHSPASGFALRITQILRTSSAKSVSWLKLNQKHLHSGSGVPPNTDVQLSLLLTEGSASRRLGISGLPGSHK